MRASKPIVLIPACTKKINNGCFQAAAKKYVDAVVSAANCHSLILPLLESEADLIDVISAADGVMLTGSVSNVHPSHYGQAVRNEELPLDPARDAVTLRMIRKAVEMGMPLFAICRGIQEVNVAFGGSLLQAVHEEPGKRDHREDLSLPMDEQYRPIHPVNVLPGSRLDKILDGARSIQVNSLHGQGIDRLAEGLSVDAVADDGLIEAFHVTGAKGFTLAVQWHPEWKVTENPISMKLFDAFGDACRQYAANKQK
jgi:putative glutamine amidotransferase